MLTILFTNQGETNTPVLRSVNLWYVCRQSGRTFPPPTSPSCRRSVGWLVCRSVTVSNLGTRLHTTTTPRERAIWVGRQVGSYLTIKMSHSRSKPFPRSLAVVGAYRGSAVAVHSAKRRSRLETPGSEFSVTFLFAQFYRSARFGETEDRLFFKNDDSHISGQFTR